MRYLGFLLVPLLLVACTDTQSPIDQQPLLNFTNGPTPVGGKHLEVARGEGYFWWWWNDFPLRAVHTNFPLNNANCGPQQDMEPWDFQTVTHINDFFDYFHVVAHADLHIIILDMTQLGDCLWGRAAVAEGMGQIRQTDNDYSGSSRHTNAWGFNAHGVLQSVAGGTVMYNGHWRGVYSPKRGWIVSERKVNLH